jgi:hypothetical protein
VLDYGIDWSEWLTTGETLTVSTWTVPSGITKDSDQRADTSTKIWLSGGTAGESYTIANKIETSDNRTDERSFEIMVEER